MNQTQTKRKRENSSLSSELIKDYLYRHPDFFVDHLDLLEYMEIPHESGNAVSLVAKQLELYREKNVKLEKQLNDLIHIARDNDNLFRRMHKLTLALFAADNLEETVASLESVLYECFDADFVSVRIIRPEPDPARSDVFVDPADAGLKHIKKILDSNRPRCGRPSRAQAKFLFKNDAMEVSSCVIIPLQCHDATGILTIGSRDKERFKPSMGHLFLKQMGELVSERLTALAPG